MPGEKFTHNALQWLVGQLSNVVEHSYHRFGESHKAVEVYRTRGNHDVTGGLFNGYSQVLYLLCAVTHGREHGTDVWIFAEHFSDRIR